MVSDCSHRFSSASATKTPTLCSYPHKLIGTGSPATYLELTLTPYSENAKRFTKSVARRLRKPGSKRGPSGKAEGSAGAVLGGFLQAATNGRHATAFRSMRSNTFTTEPVGYRVAKHTLDGLAALGWIKVRVGNKARAGRITLGDRATEFTILAPLLEEAARFGIVPTDILNHFRPQKLASVALRAEAVRDYSREKKPGRNMTVDYSNLRAAESKAALDQINDYLAAQEITMIHDGASERRQPVCRLRRIFSMGDTIGHDYKKGGRIYAIGRTNFQMQSKAARGTIQINGEPTVEIDITACQLVILHGLAKHPLPCSVDPYHGLAIERPIAKSFVLQLIGSGKIPRRWSRDTANEYYELKGRCLHCDWPIAKVRAAVLAHFPLLRKWESLPITWADLQFVDSEIMLATLLELKDTYDIAALPVHDSIIIRYGNQGMAKEVLAKKFARQAGIWPQLKFC